MFIIAGVLAVLGVLVAYWAHQHIANQRAETARLLSIICGVLAALFVAGGLLGWGAH